MIVVAASATGTVGSMDQPPASAEPPVDPEEWSDEQWLAWLADTDSDTDVDDEQPRVVGRWRERSVPTVLGAAMLGLRDAIYGPRHDEIVVVADAPGEPHDDDVPVVHLDPDHPERSQARVHRPSGRRAPRRRG